MSARLSCAHDNIVVVVVLVATFPSEVCFCSRLKSLCRCNTCMSSVGIGGRVSPSSLLCAQRGSFPALLRAVRFHLFGDLVAFSQSRRSGMFTVWSNPVVDLIIQRATATATGAAADVRGGPLLERVS